MLIKELPETKRVRELANKMADMAAEGKYTPLEHYMACAMLCVSIEEIVPGIELLKKAIQNDPCAEYLIK